MRPATPFLARLVASALVASALVGCSDAAESTDTDDAAITASAANEGQYDLKEHVVAGDLASAEAARVLGIAKWDVYAGTDTKSGFSGTVFYASDSNGDVKYAFSVDVVTTAAAMVIMDKAGIVTGDKVDAAKSAPLFSEIERLAATVEKNAATPAGTSGDRVAQCAWVLAKRGLAMVVGSGLGAIVGAAFFVGGVGTNLTGNTKIGGNTVVSSITTWAGIGAAYAYVIFETTRIAFGDSPPTACLKAATR